MSASVIIPVRDASATLGAQLAALEGQDTDAPFEIVVVENGSRDGSRELAAAWRARLSNLHLLEEGNPGSSAARNTGARAANSDLLLFCDADDVVAPGWVRAMTAALERFDLVGGAMEFELLNGPRVLASRSLTHRIGLSSTLGHLPYASSANLGIRRDAFERIDGFDRAFSAAAEDADFSWRAQYAGLSIGFAPTAVVHYRYRNSLRDLCQQMYRYASGNEALYVKHRQLGHISTPPRVRYKVAAFQVLRAVIRASDILSRDKRWRYLGQLARCAGTITGLVQYRLLWLPARGDASRHHRFRASW